jgi:integrase/recombinase XerD
MPHPRRALPFEDWPEGDRARWTAGTTGADPLDEPGLAADWSPKTLRTIKTRHGLWLACLRDRGHLDANVPPAARLTREHLLEYWDDLRARGLGSVTIAGYFRDLRQAVRVMEPGADLSVITHLWTRLEAVAEPVRNKRLRLVSPALLLDTAISEMARLQELPEQRVTRRTAERFRDALIVAFFATRPIRLANMAAIELGRHLTKNGDRYWCRFAAHETKEHRPLAFPLPEALTVWVDHYLALHRRLLLRGIETPRLWITIRATAMEENTIYYRVRHTTKQLVGKPVNPHLFRDCVATFIAEQAPGEVKIIARILGHATLATAEEHYNHAGMLSAQARYLEALARLRGQADHLPQQPSR